jgi:hypothetical protein
VYRLKHLSPVKKCFPQKDWIIDAIHARILPLSWHTVTTQWNAAALLQRSKAGV